LPNQFLVVSLHNFKVDFDVYLVDGALLAFEDCFFGGDQLVVLPDHFVELLVETFNLLHYSVNKNLEYLVWPFELFARIEALLLPFLVLLLFSSLPLQRLLLLNQLSGVQLLWFLES